MGHNEPKTRCKHFFRHTMWSRIIFWKKFIFWPPVDLVDTFWCRPFWATSFSFP